MPRTDLNLLIVLDALLEECSVSKAAKKLNVTPPAISKSLNKLREAFQDQILVRSGSLLILTPLAVELKPQIHNLIKNIDAVLNHNLSFDAGSASLMFNIVSNDLLISLLNSGFLDEMQDKEPNVVLDFSYDHGAADFLRKDNIDLYIGESRKLSPEIKIRTIHRDKCIIVANKNHEILRLNKTLENIASFGFISTRSKLNDDVDSLFTLQGFQRKIVGINPSYFSTIETVMRTSSLAVVPFFFLNALESFNVDVIAFEPQITLPEVNIIQAWHPRHDNSPPHKWLRDNTKDFLRKKVSAGV
ncbi:LysR family transcriptional regulator [Winslowiella iniecta]|uniref:HTH lysR-type domain-containing protein n=1 Tax=Winslowiella iniecta TaxID=1560201 RepID=A0A0L7T561_9GAMM|nr:LysR family transcriptional regulator [Winslowiella iniecta]KOC88576.1 hypothetical protein NG42_16155 [Winslowiella iniecta]KOC90544.1 hypothetical protein NG43_16835 [Winslowiella iniecta]